MRFHQIARSVMLVGTVVSTIGCDQVTKHLARTHLVHATAISFLGGSVRIALAQNEGGFLSLGASLPPGLRSTVFLVGVAAVLLLAAAYLVSPISLRFSGLLCGWFIWAGGLSNLLDRVLFEGRVTDFMVVGIGPLHTGVFNVADVAIVVGGLLLMFSTWRHQSSPPLPQTPSPSS